MTITKKCQLSVWDHPVYWPVAMLKVAVATETSPFGVLYSWTFHSADPGDFLGVNI